jgi:tRNA(Ile)-lysidine synthase
VRRLVLRHLAEQAGGELRAGDTERILALGGRGSKSLDLGGGVRVVVEYGTLRFTRAGEPAVPDPVVLTVPGRARFGDWEVEAAAGVAGDVSVTGVTGPLTVRAWREGDRMRPSGLGGTKTLQDLFTDKKVPRELRRTLPVVVAGDDEIVWVAGVAVDERFAAGADAAEAVGLSATQRQQSR